MSKNTSQNQPTIEETKALQKAIDEAIEDAKQNTTKGQIFSQFLTVIIFIIVVCSFVSVALIKLFNSYGDQTVKYPNYLFGSDFYVNVSDVIPTEQLQQVRPKLTNHEYKHDIRHDFYACKQPILEEIQNVSYNFSYISRLHKTGLQFTVSSKFESNFAFMKIFYDDSQQITLIDKLCINESCVKLKDLQGYNFASHLQCKQSKPCTFTLELQTHRQPVFDVVIQLDVAQTRINTTNCYYFKSQFNFTQIPILVIKSNFNHLRMKEAPDLELEFQNIAFLQGMRIAGGVSGVVLFAILVGLYLYVWKSWEKGIKEQIINDQKNKVSLQQHIDRIKMQIKPGKKEQ